MTLDFDRGTLLVGDPPSHVETVIAPLARFDTRVGRWRAAACDHARLVRALDDAGIAFDDRVRCAVEPSGPWSDVPLRPYQAAALASWHGAGRRGVVVLPTGAGKTRVALAAIADGRRRALCLTPTRVLLAQWAAEFARFTSGDVGVLGDGTRHEAPVTVATYESALRHLPRIGNAFDLLVVDEAHHCGGLLREDVLALAIAHDRLGLTATPPRAPEAALAVERSIGPVVYELSLADLAGGTLAPLSRCTIRVRLTRDERSRLDALRGAYRPYVREFFAQCPGADWAALACEAQRSAEGRTALAALRAARRLVDFHDAKAEVVRTLLERHRDARVLVFTGGNDAAYRVARENLVMPITCEIGRAERAAMLAAFASGTVRALVSARVLNEGVDVPEAEIGIVVGGSSTDREHVQRVGRLLRPHPGKRALVYELVTASTAEERLDELRREALTRRGRDTGVGAAR